MPNNGFIIGKIMVKFILKFDSPKKVTRYWFGHVWVMFGDVWLDNFKTLLWLENARRFVCSAKMC